MFELGLRRGGMSQIVRLGDGGRWRIGRAATCEIRVADPHVSAEHAELALVAEGLRLTQTGGSNPIMVDGEVVESAVVRPGASFSIGDTLFTVLEAGQTPAQPAGASVHFQRTDAEVIAIGVIIAALIAAGALLVLAGTRPPQKMGM